jgi:uncharacterized YigZ family protein
MIVLRSRFIAVAAPAFTLEAARAAVAAAAAEFPDASHHVPAYIVGAGASTISHSSDNGEPSGSAGRPSLAVLAGSGLSNIVVVTTRYFGGTKLGIGGLVRAYGDAVRAVLEVTPRAQLVQVQTVLVAIPYNWVERLRRLVAAHDGALLDEDFAAEVTVTARFPVDRLDAFRAALQEASAGTLALEAFPPEDAYLPLS